MLNSGFRVKAPLRAHAPVRGRYDDRSNIPLNTDTHCIHAYHPLTNTHLSYKYHAKTQAKSPIKVIIFSPK